MTPNRMKEIVERAPRIYPECHLVRDGGYDVFVVTSTLPGNKMIAGYNISQQERQHVDVADLVFITYRSFTREQVFPTKQGAQS